MGSDCAPEDPAAWSIFAYTDRDADGDGRTVPSPGALCVGGVVPSGYFTGPQAPDCDDADGAVWQLRAGYADADGDGVGAGDVVELCTGAALPSGWVVGPNDDCAPDDVAAWRGWTYAHRDADGDGRTVPEAGTLCIGAAPPVGYASTVEWDGADEELLLLLWRASGLARPRGAQTHARGAGGRSPARRAPLL